MSAGVRLGGRSLLFAFVAGLAAVPAILVGAPVAGWAAVCSAVALAAAVLYTAAVAPSWARALPAAALAALLALVVGLLASTVGEAAVGAALVVGVIRSGVLYRRRAARSLAIEIALLVAGLLFARFLAAPSALGAGLAIWGFFLVQSLFFVVSGWERRQSGDEGVDRFDEAERRVLDVLGSAGSG